MTTRRNILYSCDGCDKQFLIRQEATGTSVLRCLRWDIEEGWPWSTRGKSDG